MQITKNNLNDVLKAKRSSIETMELKGYKLLEEYFVDSSGFGADNEPALTINNFMIELKKIVNQYGLVTAKITGVGQFQVFVALFTRTGKRQSKIVANNTLERKENDKKIIRLYDTDIVTFDGNKIILNTGGFNTRTTTDRMNQFLSDGYVYRRNWHMYCNYKGIVYKFNDNDTLTIHE